MQDNKIMRLSGGIIKFRKTLSVSLRIQILFEELLKVFEQEDDILLMEL